MLLEDFFRLMDQQSLQGKPKNSQHDQNVPNTVGENNATRSQKNKKTRKDNKKKVAGQPPPRLARGVQHGPWWLAQLCCLVGAGRASHPSPGCSVSFVTF